MAVAPSRTTDTFVKVEGCAAGASSPGEYCVSDRSITFTLADTDVLDCSICLEPLNSPIFQCSNGHIACSSCCVTIANKCPSCSLVIGDNQCRALEKVLESVRMICKFSNYGCKETFSYYKRQDHEKSCPHTPFYCPHDTCSFIGSSKQLLPHFTSEHRGYITSFCFRTSKSIYLGLRTKFHVLHEESEDALFLLTNGTDPLGNKITVSSIGPRSKRYYLDDLVADYRNSCVKLQTFISSIHDPVRDSELCPYLMIPKAFISKATTINLKFIISDYSWLL